MRDFNMSLTKAELLDVLQAKEAKIAKLEKQLEEARQHNLVSAHRFGLQYNEHQITLVDMDGTLRVESLTGLLIQPVANNCFNILFQGN